MAEYKVEWAIDVDAENPVEAAALAQQLHSYPDNTATCYTVCNISTGMTVDVDLGLPVGARVVSARMSDDGSDRRYLRELVRAALNVTENWERGDLAAAVRHLDAVAQRAQLHLQVETWFDEDTVTRSGE